MNKKTLPRKFKTSAEMDQFLETADLAEDFKKRGVLKKGHIKKINLDLPDEMIQRIDQIAQEIGVSRQPLLKIWIHERLKVEGIK